MNAYRYRLLATVIWLLAGPILIFPAIAPGLAVVALAVLLGTRLLAGRFGLRVWERTFLDGFILVMMLLAIAAYFISPLPEHSLPKLTALLWGIAGYYLAQDWLGERRDLDRLTIVLALAAVGVAVVSLFTVDWPTRVGVVNLNALYNLLPGLGVIHRNEAAIVLCLLLPFPAGWIWRGTGRWRWAAAAGTGLVLVVILLTQSRAAVLALVGMGVAAWLWSRFSVRLVLGAGLAAVLVVLAIALWPGQTVGLAETVAQVDQATRPGEVLSWAVRVDLWQAAGQALQEYPVLGTGLFAFYDVARANYVFAYAGFDQDLVHAHNLFLQAGVDMGWPGLILLLLFWGTVIFFLWRLARPGAAPVWARYARWWGVSVTGYLVFTLVDVVTLGNRPGFLIWLVLAGAAALVRLAPGKGAQELRAPQRVLAWVPMAVLLVLAPIWLPRNLANGQLDRVLLKQEEGDEFSPETFAGDPRRAGWVAYFQGDDEAALVEWAQMPQGGAYLAGRGFAAHRERRLDEAFRLYGLALALEPGNGQVHYWRGLINESRGEGVAAEADMATAAGLVDAQANPEFAAQVHYKWAELLAAQGSWVEARPVVETAIDLQPDRAAFYQLLGEILLALDDPAGAEAAFEQAEQRP